MSKVPVSTKSRVVMADGTYVVACIEVKDDVIESEQYGVSEVVRIYLEFEEVKDEDGEPAVLDAIANRKISKKAKLTRWATAMGVAPDLAANDFETEDLVAQRCMAVVVNRVDGTEKWPRVTDLVALPKSVAGRQSGTVVRQEAAATTPAMITADYTLDFTAFWAACKTMGIDRALVAGEVGGDLAVLQTMDPMDVVAIYNRLAGVPA